MTDALGRMETVVADAERLGDEAILAEAFWRLGVLRTWLGDNTTGERLLRRALEHARPLDAVHLKSQVSHWLALVLLWGSTPVEKAREECRELAESLDLDQTAQTELLVVQGVLAGLGGDFEHGRRLAAEGREALRQLGQRVQHAAIAQPSAVVELLAGNAPAAERMLREARAILSAAGERGYLSTVSALLALALVKEGKYAEAEELADEGRRIGAEDDLTTQTYWRIAKAHVAAARGARDEAARLAAEVLDLATDFDTFDGPVAVVEVVDYLEPEAARTALELAIAGAEAKGNVVTAAQARAKLAALP